MQTTEGHNLERFIAAQKSSFYTALSEMEQGRKRSHWMWYIFPQISGLGFSEASNYYAISDLAEAAAYLKHRTLGCRMILICETLLKLDETDAHLIFGSPDDLKFHSSLTLFASVPGSHPVFTQLLKKFFSGLKDNKTLKILSLTSL